MQSATGCVILGNQDKMPWLTHPILDNMSGSALSLPQQKYIITREFGHFFSKETVPLLLSAVDTTLVLYTEILNIKAQQHICLTALNTTKTSSVSSKWDPAYPSYYFHHTEPL